MHDHLPKNKSSPIRSMTSCLQNPFSMNSQFFVSKSTCEIKITDKRDLMTIDFPVTPGKLPVDTPPVL